MEPRSSWSQISSRIIPELKFQVRSCGQTMMGGLMLPFAHRSHGRSSDRYACIHPSKTHQDVIDTFVGGTVCVWLHLPRRAQQVPSCHNCINLCKALHSILLSSHAMKVTKKTGLWGPVLVDVVNSDSPTHLCPSSAPRPRASKKEYSGTMRLCPTWKSAAAYSRIHHFDVLSKI